MPPAKKSSPLTLTGAPRRKPGPKPKPLSERALAKRMKPITRVERSYSSQRRVQVILYLIQHRVHDPEGLLSLRLHAGIRYEGEYRPPLFSEAATFFKIPISTISNWWQRREKILNRHPDQAALMEGCLRRASSAPSSLPPSATTGDDNLSGTDNWPIDAPDGSMIEDAPHSLRPSLTTGDGDLSGTDNESINTPNGSRIEEESPSADL